jgi:hypothetical protein
MPPGSPVLNFSRIQKWPFGVGVLDLPTPTGALQILRPPLESVARCLSRLTTRWVLTR